jgi:hypothetical protein
MTNAHTELNAYNWTINQKALLVCKYNGQNGTSKQVDRVLKAYPTHEYLDRFLVPRWDAIKASCRLPLP